MLFHLDPQQPVGGRREVQCDFVGTVDRPALTRQYRLKVPGRGRTQFPGE